MLGRRPLASGALASPIVGPFGAGLGGGASTSLSAGTVRPLSAGLTGPVSASLAARSVRPLAATVASGAVVSMTANAVRPLAAALAAGTASRLTQASVTFRAALVGGGTGSLVAKSIRPATVILAGGAAPVLAAGSIRALSAALDTTATPILVARSARQLGAALAGPVSTALTADVIGVTSATLAGGASATLVARKYNPALVRIYGPVAADWDTPRVLAIWADMIEEGDIIMKDKAMIAGTNAAKVVRLYPDNGDVGTNGIKLEGCHSFVARAKRVDGTGPVVTLSAIVEGDPAQGRVRLEHAADAFAPGVYEIQITYKDGADHNHAYPDDGESLRLEVKAAI